MVQFKKQNDSFFEEKTENSALRRRVDDLSVELQVAIDRFLSISCHVGRI